MANLTNSSFKFFKGQTMAVTTAFVEGTTEYPHGKILTIEKVVKDCFVADDGHKVSKVWLTNGAYFNSDFIMEHTKPSQLRVFRRVIAGLKKSRDAVQSDLEQITGEADKLSAFFGDEIMKDLDNMRTEKRAEIERKIADITASIAYYTAMDIAVQRFLIHCETTNISYKIDNKVETLFIDFGFSGFKTLVIDENTISYGGNGVWTDLFTADVSGAFESQALGEYYPADDAMAQAIQKLLRQFLSEAGFCFTEADEYF